MRFWKRFVPANVQISFLSWTDARTCLLYTSSVYVKDLNEEKEILINDTSLYSASPVSYTHLDVYKRQDIMRLSAD